MLHSLNQLLQKLMPIITPVSVVIGIIFANHLHHYEFLVTWIFAFMTFSGSLGSNFTDLKKVMQHPFSLILSLIILHLVMPFIALGIGHLAFSDNPYLITGLVLAFLIPTGITSLIWVSVYKGNVVLTLSIILIDTLLSPFIVPPILHMFVGASVQMNGMEIMQGLMWMVVLPSLLGMLINQLTKGQVSHSLAPALAPFSKIGIGAVVAINSSAVASYFRNINGTLILIAVIVFLIAVSGYFVGWLMAKLLKESTDIMISLTFNSGMRNISAGAVIAITYFPAQVALPVIVGMLFQQVIASFTGSVLQRLYHSPAKHDQA